MPLIERIVSGGQTEADRAALDWAIEYNIPHGGRCRVIGATPFPLIFLNVAHWVLTRCVGYAAIRTR